MWKTYSKTSCFHSFRVSRRFFSMSKRKLVTEIASGSDGKVKIYETGLNNLFGDSKDESNGKLELGPTMLDVTKGLKIVTKKNGDEPADKYTIMMYISRGFLNTAVQFFEIESQFSKNEIIELLFKHLKSALPGDEKVVKGKNRKQRYFRQDGEFPFLLISEDHAYIYIGDSDGKSYKNDITDAMNFIYRKDPENRPSLCSIM